jgi:hypothetical protein
MSRGFESPEIESGSSNPILSQIVLLDANEDLVSGVGLSGDWFAPVLLPNKTLTDWSIIRIYYEDASVGFDAGSTTFSFLPLDPSAFEYSDAMNALLTTTYKGDVGFVNPTTWTGAYVQFDLGKVHNFQDESSGNWFHMSAYDLWVGPYQVIVNAFSNFGEPAVENPDWTRNYDHLPENTGIAIISEHLWEQDEEGEDTDTLKFYTSEENTTIRFAVGQIGGNLNQVHFRLFEPNYELLIALQNSWRSNRWR